MIALLTDFGLSDAYVGILRGVLGRLAPGAPVVDLCHGVSPGDVRQGAYLLATALGYFPPSTLFVCVVDPGVGTNRRVLALETGRYRFLAPDNGLLSEVLEVETARELVAVDRPDLYLPGVSATFHGRDIFAPVAAHIHQGEPLSALGPPVADPVLLQHLWAEEGKEEIRARVIHADHFGNLVTDLRSERLSFWSRGAPVLVEIGANRVRGLATTYSDHPAGTLMALIGSSGRLEVCVAGGSALEALRSGPRPPVLVSREAPPPSPSEA